VNKIPKSRFLLTISIPTYNRAQFVVPLVESLLRQLAPEVFLRVIDNASATDVADVIRRIVPAEQAQQVEIIRNTHNVGGAANLVRSFELCQTEWLWILGDDDTVRADAICSALAAIAANAQSVAITFSSPRYVQDHCCNTHGAAGYLDHVSSFSAAVFNPTVLYRASSMLPAIRFGYHCLCSMAPHLAMLLLTLGSEAVASFSERSLIAVHRDPPATDRWSPIVHLVGRGTLLDLPLDHSTRRRLSAMMASRPRLETLALQQWLLVLRGCDREYARHLFDQAYYRVYTCCPGALTRTRALLYRALFRCPRIAVEIARVVLAGTRRVSPWKLKRLEDLDATELFSRV